MTNVVENIHIGDIEAELSRLWENQKDKNSIRASLFNLIIYANTERRLGYLTEIAQAILERFPCRILFIKGSTAYDSDYLNVKVATLVSKKGEISISCDQIIIDVGYKQLHRVPFVILPHLITDLPVYLLWGQDPSAESDIFPYLIKFASRVIFDSDCIEDLQVFSPKMVDLMKQVNVDIVDLNWGLIGGWRDLLSQIFDTQEHLEQLACSKSIHITYNARVTESIHHPEIQAIYLQGWFASQLEWKYKRVEKAEEGWRVVYSNGVNDIEVTLFPELVPDLTPGNILALEIASVNDYYFAIMRKPKQQKVSINISSLEKCELPFAKPLPDTKRGFNFMKEIFYYCTCDHYRRMLEILGQIIWNPRQ